MPVPLQYRDPDAARRIAAIATSFERLLGRPLVPPGEDIVERLWRARRAILAHGTQDDPIFYFGNRYALDAFGYDIEAFLRTPSRLSAEAPLRDERQALLDRVATNGFIDDYSGVRITASGECFAIARAIVWNVTDGDGCRFGQAATFTL